MPSPSADAAQSQSHGSFSLSQSHAHAIQSQSAISTAAAVAAMSGSFQQAQNQAVPHTSAAAPSNLSPIATATNAIAAVSVSASSGTKSKLSLATSNNNQSHSNSQGLSIQTMNAKAGTTTSLPVQHHGNMQQTSTLAGHSLPLSQASNQVQAPAYSSFALPQHLNYNSLSFHSYTYHRPPPDSTPQIFLNTPLRRGKWTNEEEEYANSIIDAFEKGTIQGCENGCTLRAYLSRKLHCQPMRISKKFAGKSIGKQVFMSRLNSASMCTDSTGGITPVMMRNSNETLKQLEFHFHMSVLQEGISADPSRAINAINTVNHSNTGACYGPHTRYQKPTNSNAAAMNALLKTWNRQTIANNQLGNVKIVHPQPKESTVSKLPIPTSTIRTYPAPRSINNTNGITTHNSGSRTMQASNNLLPQAQSNMPGSQMHQNLFNAFKQAQTSHAFNEHDTFDAPKKKSHVASADSTAVGVHGIENHGKAERNEKPQTVTSKSTSEDLTSGNAQQNWINETMAIIPTLDPTNYAGRYSPTYTSKSFDDLHKFLGQGVPRIPRNDQSSSKGNVGEGVAGPATEAANRLIPKLFIKVETDGIAQQITTTNESTQYPVLINAADEYAFHAQLFAMEASKHSAYNSAPLSPPKSQPVAIKRIDTPIIQAREVKKQSYVGNSNVASFNNENLERHSKAVYNLGIQGVPPMPLGRSGTNSFTKYTSPNFSLKQGGPIVSGSEFSSEMGDIGTDGSTSVGGTSSFNDSASDEGRRPIRSTHKEKRKSNDIEAGHCTEMSARSTKIAKHEGNGLQ